VLTPDNHGQVRRASGCRRHAAENKARRYPNLRQRVSPAARACLEGVRYGIEAGSFADKNVNVLA
jgi:hypothetical protein